MIRALSLIVTLLTLAGCGMPLAAPGALGGANPVDTSLDVGAFAGLASDIAAHPSIQLARPAAFALTAESQPFLQALARTVDPQRRELATRLAADRTVTQAVSQWSRLNADTRLEALRRVAAIEGEVMGFAVPPIEPSADAPEQENVQAYFQPTDDGVGSIVVYTSAVARGTAYRAIATVVHEARHAAQFQLAFGNAPKEGDAQVLGAAYAAAWQVTNELGDESKLAYGDYIHLNAEYDAFQTGNQVAALLSGGQLDTLGYGFVDMQYDRNGAPVFDALGHAAAVGRELIVAVNQAEYTYERTRGGTMVPRPRDRRGGRFR